MGRSPKRAERRYYSDEAAEFVGVQPATWRRYCSTANGRRRIAPPEDGTTVDRRHVRPWWYESTLVTFRDRDKTPGVRNDLIPARPAVTKKTTRKRTPR